MKESFEHADGEAGLNKPSLIKKALEKVGMASALLASMAGGAEAQVRPADDVFAAGSLPKVTRQYKPTQTVRGDRYVGLANLDNTLALETKDIGQDVSLAIQHNIKRPESLAELGKMLLEPVSVSLSFPYGKDNLVAMVRTRIGYEDGETQVIDVEIPYRYAQKFDTADPKDREKMKEQAMDDARKLFDKILTNVSGLSFFKREAGQHHREFSAPLTEVDSMKVEGFASPESTDGVNLGDVRNQGLSKLRAENAAATIRELFKEKNIGVEEITFQGEGEDALSAEELKRLAEEAVKLDLSNINSPQNTKVLKIIKDYNAGSITEDSALKLLDEVVGGKRKVAVHLEINNEKKVFVLPLPLLLAAWPIIRKISSVVDDWRGGGSWEGFPHHFIRSQDPTRPTEEVARIATDGSIERINVERVTLEANRFFNNYGRISDPDHSFFIVSSSNTNDLETADVYRQVAQQRGFNVIRPGNTNPQHRNIGEDDLAGGFVRVIDSLSVDPGQSQEDLYNREFKNLIRLLNFGQRKISQSAEQNPSQPHVSILAFGEDDTVQHALRRYFNQPSLGNLEVIDFKTMRNPRRARARFRGRTKKVR